MARDFLQRLNRCGELLAQLLVSFKNGIVSHSYSHTLPLGGELFAQLLGRSFKLPVCIYGLQMERIFLLPLLPLGVQLLVCFISTSLFSFNLLIELLNQ